MTLSDDSVVSKAACGECGPTYFRDLDKHIQDRLRAAEEMAEASREAEGLLDGEPGMGPLRPLWSALAAYEATFTEGGN